MRQLTDLRPDAIAFQEVDLRTDQGNCIRERSNLLLHGQGDRDPYMIHHMANTRENVTSEALAIMTRLRVTAHEGFDYLFRNRVAHRARIDVDGTAFDLYNTHLHHMVGPEHNAAQVRQAEQLRHWIAGRSGDLPVVLVGDFNSTPGTKPLRVLGESLRPAYEDRHGEPPESTISPLLAAGGELPDGLPEAIALDHIFVSPSIDVLEASVCFADESPDAPGIYASDHFGLVARLRFQARVGRNRP